MWPADGLHNPSEEIKIMSMEGLTNPAYSFI